MKILYKKIVFAAGLAGLIAANGCREYLEVEPVSQYSISETFSSVENATYALYGAYDDLTDVSTYGLRLSDYFPYDSDEAMQGGNLDNGRRGIGRYDLRPGNVEIGPVWRQLYRGIERSNLIIEQIPLMSQYNNGTETEKRELRRMYGEALTLRAQYFSELLKNWGDVPAPFIPAYRQTNTAIPRANRDETYDQLIKDLAVAKELVPWRTAAGVRNERITKGAVMALRAKLALFRGGYSLRESKMERRSDYLKYYQIARDETAELMQHRDQHRLNPSFENVFRNIHSKTFDPYGEIVFEVGSVGSGTSGTFIGWFDGPSTNVSSRYGQSLGGIRVIPTYFYAFDPADTRLDVTITVYGIGISPNNVAALVNHKAPQTLVNITTGKFRRDWRVPLIPGTSQTLGLNYPLIRFSDVLLMFAEAENELKNGPTAEAIAALEEVRLRAFKGDKNKIGVTPTDKTGFFDAIVHERYLEFGGEGIRKYDLLRWNMLHSKLVETRANLVKLMNGTDQYAGLPQFMYWRNKGEEIEWYNSFYQSTPSPEPPLFDATTNPNGWRKLAWRENIVTARIDNRPYTEAPGRLFRPGVNELMPIDQATLDSYNGQLQQNNGY